MAAMLQVMLYSHFQYTSINTYVPFHVIIPDEDSQSTVETLNKVSSVSKYYSKLVSLDSNMTLKESIWILY